ncbi:at-rich interactive domain-containing protein 5 [Citrus sinensis]|uniref:At-rich interactive domain-containing protein 5 n=1 Tax=Citrus sinensis TaxID=2711 RepID=A0ACB8KZQ7_CITSI|nr:at-rich interactive domain-containing protein 5 [Citrus sinensis]
MVDQDSLHISEANLVEASAQQQQASQQPSENGQSSCRETAEDKPETLPSVDEVFPEKSDAEATAGVNTKSGGGGGAGTDELPESTSKTNGDDTHVENEPKTNTSVTPIPHGESSTSKAEDESVRKSKNWLNDIEMGEADEGTPEEQAEFMKEIESFYRENALEFKPPKFYGEPLNCLKLWRAVVRLGGYEVVTASKLWRQVGESFHPPKTCTTVSWTFRIFYEKALLEYEKHKRLSGELQLPASSFPQPTNAGKEMGTISDYMKRHEAHCCRLFSFLFSEQMLWIVVVFDSLMWTSVIASGYQTPGSSRARRDAAARAMQGWHAQRLLGHGEVAEPIIKDKSLPSPARREKQLKNIGLPKNRTLDSAEKAALTEADKQIITEIVDVGPPADWVKINVREAAAFDAQKDCYEVYALVPGLLREEVRVQSDPAGRLVITGEPEQVDNPWGITPFKKVVILPSRIDPLQTSAVVSLHGRLYVRVPFEGSA